MLEVPGPTVKVTPDASLTAETPVPAWPEGLGWIDGERVLLGKQVQGQATRLEEALGACNRDKASIRAWAAQVAK